MFEGLSSRFEGILRKVRGRGRLGPEDVEEFLAEVRVALLEADVHLDVVRTLLDRIRDRAVGVEVAGASLGEALQWHSLRRIAQAFNPQGGG